MGPTILSSFRVLAGELVRQLQGFPNDALAAAGCQPVKIGASLQRASPLGVYPESCREMNVQVIMREGQPEYAVLPWTEYQALLQAAAKRDETLRPVKSDVQPAGLASLKDLSGLRQSRGISREDLARSVGISPHYLAMIETGERVAEGPIARALAQALGVAGWEGGN